MTTNIFIFLGTFVVGALVALGVRTARHAPHKEHSPPAAVGGAYAPMVSNGPARAAEPAAPGAHTGHAQTSNQAPANDARKKPVNTVCAICGMEVDPSLPTMEYQGQTIGFGCKMCPPKMAAEPDKYGPWYLRNEVLKR